MKAEEIEILIGVDGNVQVEGHGFTGGECLKLTEHLEQALGAVERRTMKPESRQRVAQVRKAGA